MLRSLSKREQPESRVVFVDPLDANAAFKYKGNSICTGKYNLFTFLPKALYEQFRRVANIYFLSVAIISLFPAISGRSPPPFQPSAAFPGASSAQHGCPRRNMRPKNQGGPLW